MAISKKWYGRRNNCQPNVETVAPQAEQLPMPTEVVEHPLDLPLTWDDAGMVLVAMQRMGVVT